MKTRSVQVTDPGSRLDKYLADILTDLSRTKIKNLIDQNLVRVNGKNEKSSYQVAIGDLLEIRYPDTEQIDSVILPENIPLQLIYEDDELVVLNKPAGLVVHPGTGINSGTLVNALAYHCTALSTVNGVLRPGIVHRLDKDTSGVMVAAKTDQAHRNLARQFEHREIDKKYIGITWGLWSEKEGSVTNPIGRKRSDPTTFTTLESGREARTDYSIVTESNYLSETHFSPKTGRTHQIRVHCAARKHPIFGDEKYGGGLTRVKGYLPETTQMLKKLINSIGRHALHASTLSFTHPKTRDRVTFRADLPGDIENIITHMQNSVEI